MTFDNGKTVLSKVLKIYETETVNCVKYAVNSADKSS